MGNKQQLWGKSGKLEREKIHLHHRRNNLWPLGLHTKKCWSRGHDCLQDIKTVLVTSQTKNDVSLLPPDLILLTLLSRTEPLNGRYRLPSSVIILRLVALISVRPRRRPAPVLDVRRAPVQTPAPGARVHTGVRQVHASICRQIFCR